MRVSSDVTNEGKPRCAKCDKSGLICAGYAKQIRFINVSSAPAAPTAWISSESSHLQATRGIIAAPNELSFVAFKDDMCVSFVFENHVWRTYGNGWIQQAALGKIDVLSQKACQALAKFNYGKYHHQSDIEAEGYEHYGHMLRLLAPALSRPKFDGLQALIVPILFLLLYSALAQDREGVESHIRGLNKLLLVCGAESFQRPPFRNAFESCRATLITVHLMIKTRTFLEQETWCSVPWAAHPTLKSSQSQISDVLVVVPGLLEDAEGHFASGILETPRDLLHRCISQLKDLFAWRWRWEQQSSGQVHEIPRLLFGKPARGQHRAYETVLKFEVYEHSSELMLYNTALLLLFGLLWKLQPGTAQRAISTAAKFLAPHELSQSPLFRPGETCSLRAPATEITRCFEFQTLHVNSGSNTALFYLFPVALASLVLKDDAMFSVWIRDMLDASPVTRGYGGADASNVYGFRWYLDPALVQTSMSSE